MRDHDYTSPSPPNACGAVDEPHASEVSGGEAAVAEVDGRASPLDRSDGNDAVASQVARCVTQVHGQSRLDGRARLDRERRRRWCRVGRCHGGRTRPALASLRHRRVPWSQEEVDTVAPINARFIARVAVRAKLDADRERGSSEGPTAEADRRQSVPARVAADGD